MGIKGLSSFLKKHATNAWAGRPVVAQEHPVKVAVDVSLFLHKFFYSNVDVRHGFATLRRSLVDFNYIPIWVFDGGKLVLKKEEHERRAAVRERRAQQDLQDAASSDCQVFDPEFQMVILQTAPSHPGRREYDAVRDDLSNDDVRIAKYEAEALCSYLVYTGEAYAAVTDDSDVLAYTCPRIFRGVRCTIEQATEVCMADILTKLEVDEDVFRIFCVLCGGDFCSNEKQTGPVSALKKAKNNHTLTDRNLEVLEVFRSFCHECSASQPMPEDCTMSPSCPTEFPSS